MPQRIWGAIKAPERQPERNMLQSTKITGTKKRKKEETCSCCEVKLKLHGCTAAASILKMDGGTQATQPP